MAREIDEKALHAALVARIGETIECESRGVTIVADTARLPLEILTDGCRYGVQKWVMDSVSGFKGKPEAEIRARMGKRLDAMYAGEKFDRTARLFSVARGVLESAYPKAEIPAKGTFALRDAKSLAFWCTRMHEVYPSDKLPQGPKPEAVLAKAERIIRERDAAVEDLA